MINAGAKPLAWHTSRRSQDNAACVEVAFAGEIVIVRDSKDKGGPVITFERSQFAAFIDETISGLSSNNGAAELTAGDLEVRYADGQRVERTHWHLRAVKTNAVLHFRKDEWEAFQIGARSGEFDAVPVLPAAG